MRLAELPLQSLLQLCRLFLLQPALVLVLQALRLTDRPVESCETEKRASPPAATAPG